MSLYDEMYRCNLFSEYLKENNAVINNKYQEIAEWKERIKKYHKHNQEKCEEAKNLILSLRAESENLRKQLQETKNSAFHSLVSIKYIMLLSFFLQFKSE